MTCKITAVICGPGGREENHSGRRPKVKQKRCFVFDSNVKNVFTQHSLCDSCVLRVCEVYSQSRHRMRINRTNVSSCTLSCTWRIKSWPTSLDCNCNNLYCRGFKNFYLLLSLSSFIENIFISDFLVLFSIIQNIKLHTWRGTRHVTCSLFLSD